MDSNCTKPNARWQHIKVAAVTWIPWIKMIERGKCIDVRGPMAEIIHSLSTALNFSFTVLSPVDKAFGSKRKKGDWTGMIGMLIRKEVDFVLTPVSATQSRFEIADFTNPIMTGPMHILTSNPVERSDLFSFFKAFQVEVWLFLGLSILLVSGISFVLQLMLPESEIRHQCMIYRFFQHFWTYFTCFLIQGLPRLPVRSSLRLLVGIWWLICLVVMCSFSGKLVSMFTSNRAMNKIDTLQDLLQHPNITIVLEDNSSFTATIKKAEKGIYKRLWKAVENNPHTTYSFNEITSENMLENIAEGTHATLLQMVTLKTELSRRYTEKGFCGFYVGKEEIFPKTSIIAMGKHLPSCFQQKLKRMIDGAVENYLFGKWIDMLTVNYTRCVVTQPSGVRQRTLFDLRGVFSCFAIGIMTSLLVFLFEKCFPTFLNL
ncbi:glutamate receptor ionotropic, kainate 1-like isoform X1 [Limulus polyphemus]|uniref:Glutamate receptor ionotropic, kainate 1-like isoform X1 n=1 Tax=Limulus polyphemus TaxID=6850 RepID=A0ABM1SNE8_LIMPO|nr:glutamate receptor ionotropic, kainate 1-like isoform X1 [Limulus polyphemus]